MTTNDANFEQLLRLWEATGAVQAYANPDGPIATQSTMSPEERLAAIWETVKDLEPRLTNRDERSAKTLGAQ